MDRFLSRPQHTGRIQSRHSVLLPFGTQSFRFPQPPLFEGRRSDKRAVRRRYGDIVSGNTKRCVCRGRAGERHTLSSPLLEGNAPTTFTCLGVGRDVHRVILKEISAPIRILDAGASERAVLDRHRIMGRAVAVRGVAVVRIHIDRVGAGVEATSSINGATGETGIGAVVFPLDRHIANPGQDCIPPKDKHRCYMHHSYRLWLHQS